MEWEELSLDGIPLREVHVPLLDQQFSMLTISDIDRAFHQLAARARLTVSGRPKKLSSTKSELCPHFGVIWPSALVLCKAIAARLDSQTFKSPGCEPFLELGAGLGLPSFLFAKMTGLPARATDRHPLALLLMELNAKRNQISTLQFERLDFCADLSNRKWSMIVGSDILYEAWQPGYVAQILATSLSQNGTAMITDPGRQHQGLFRECVAAQGFQLSEFIDQGVTVFKLNWLP